MSEDKLNICENCGQALDSDGLCPKCAPAINENTKTNENPTPNESPSADEAPAFSENSVTDENPTSFLKKALLFVKEHKKVISIASAAAVFVIALVGILIAVFVPSPSDKLLKAADEGNLAGLGALAYVEEMQEIHGNPRKQAKLEKTAKKKVEKIYEDFKRGKTTYETAYVQVNSYNMLTKSDSATEKYMQDILDKMDALNNSAQAYELALGFEENGDVNSALLKYAEVVEDDKSYKDARSRIEKLSNTFVETLKGLEATGDYRAIIMQGAGLSQNQKITEGARSQIVALVNNAKSVLKADAEKLLTVEAKERDTGGTYLFATTKTFESTNNDGLKITLFGGIDPEKERASLGLRIAFYPKEYAFVNKAFIGTTDNNITGDADVETDYAGYGQYYVDGGADSKYFTSGVCGFYEWDELKKLYDIMDGKEQVYLKVYASYADASFSFPIPEDLRLSLLALLDYRLATYKEKPADTVS